MKLLFKANGGHHRKSQLDPMQQSMKCGKQSPRRYINKTALASVAQGPVQKRQAERL